MDSKKYQPLNDMEMFETMRLIYPEHFKDDDQSFDLAGELLDSPVDIGNGVQVELADLIGRLVSHTVPINSVLTDTGYHCIGDVSVSDDRVNMIAVVKREVQTQGGAK